MTILIDCYPDVLGVGLLDLGTCIINNTNAAISVTTPANMKDDSVPYLFTRYPANIGAGKLRN